MKKLTSLTAVAIAALALVGCSQDGVVNEAPSANQAIEFGTYLGRDAQGQTRAAAATLETLKKGVNGFGVFAYYTQKTSYDSYTKKNEPNFMYNQGVTYTAGSGSTSGAWTYSPKKYWPNNDGDKVSFVAYAPYDKDIAITNTEATDLKIKYTVTNTVAEPTGDNSKSQDLLYTEVMKDKEKPEIVNEKVTFEFKHALSRIGFTVQGAIDQTAAGGTIDAGTTITVKRVMLSGGPHEYTGQGDENVTVSNTGAFYSSGKFNLLSGKWSDEDGALLFDLGPANFIDKNTTVADTQFELKGEQTKATPLNKDDSYLMIIPQDFSATNAPDMYVYIEYTVTTTDGTNEKNNSEITNYISTKAPIKFEQGTAYTINLVLGMDSVDLDVSNDISWGTEGNEQVDLPKNEGGTTGGTGDTENTETPGAGA